MVILLSMVIKVIDIGYVRTFKPEDDAPVATDVNSPESFVVAGERMQPQAGKIHIPWFTCCIQAAKDKANTFFMTGLYARLAAGYVEFGKTFVSKDYDHGIIVTWWVTKVKQSTLLAGTPGWSLSGARFAIF
jgi:hypothetical protein